MKQPKSIQISIPQPCTQDWSKMTPQQQGRFCDSCKKCVVDFTGFTDEQLYKFFTEHKGQKVCGRMKKTQLNRAIALPPQPHSTLYKWVIAAGLGLVFVAAPETEIFAQVPYTQEQTNINNDTTSNQTNDTFSISGVVVDENNEPVINAMVEATQNGITKNDAVTDFDGKFIIKPMQQGEYTLTVRYIGYQDEERIVRTDTLNSSLKVSLTEHLKIEDIDIIMGMVPLYHPIDTIPKIEVEKNH